MAVAGGNYGEIWGTTYLRVTDENSPYYGKMLLNDAICHKVTQKYKRLVINKLLVW
ncbi:hypothetical protein NXW27_27015 [Phocaeicola dorei]|nr:hypothetical protein [Phocaeicola dorei]